MKRLVVIASLILLFANIHVKADTSTCKKDELNRLRALAREINFTYEFNEVKDDNGDVTGGTFDIILDNITKETKPLVIYSWTMLSYDEFVPDANGTDGSKSVA